MQAKGLTSCKREKIEIFLEFSALQIKSGVYIGSRLKSMMYNLGQRAVDKFTKLSKIGFSMKCFAVDILGFFTGKRQNLIFG